MLCVFVCVSVCLPVFCVFVCVTVRLCVFCVFSVSASAVGGKSAAVSIRSVALDSPNAVFKEAECASTSAPLFASSLAASKQVPLAGSPPTPPHTMVNGVSPILFSRST